MNITIAQTQDLFSIQCLLRAAQLPSEDLQARHLAHFQVFRSEGNIVGAVGLEAYPPMALLRSLVVDSSQQGRSLGKALVESMEALARQNGITMLVLLTTTATSFFERLGYTPISRSNAPTVLLTTTEFAELVPPARCV